MRIALDLDGVIYNWGDTARYLLREHRGVELPESDYWDYIKDHVSEEDWKWLWSEGVELGLFRNGHIMKGARDAILAMSDAGHDLLVITHRPRAAVLDTLDFLSFHKLPIPELHVLGSEVPKSSVLPQAQVYVDDSPNVMQDLMKNTGVGYTVPLVWDRPWNTDAPGLRVYSWDGVLRVVKELRGTRLAV